MSLTIDKIRRSSPTRDDALELAWKFERIIEPFGYHIGLTGSALYGDCQLNSAYDNAPNIGDIDFIIYTHHDSSICWSKITIEELLNKLDCENVRPAKELTDYETFVYKANYKDEYRDLKIDFIVLECHDGAIL